MEFAEYFRAGSFIDTPFNLKYTTEGLVKLLMYGDYVKNKAELQNTTTLAIVENELGKYQYKRKTVLKVVLLIDERTNFK